MAVACKCFKWRDEYAEDWPSSLSHTTATSSLDGHRNTHHKPRKNATNRNSQSQDQRKLPMQGPPEQEDAKEQTKTVNKERPQQSNNDQKENQKGCPQSRLIPLPGGRKRLTILMKLEVQEIQVNKEKTSDESVTVGCPLFLFGHIQPRHWRAFGHL